MAFQYFSHTIENANRYDVVSSLERVRQKIVDLETKRDWYIEQQMKLKRYGVCQILNAFGTFLSVSPLLGHFRH